MRSQRFVPQSRSVHRRLTLRRQELSTVHVCEQFLSARICEAESTPAYTVFILLCAALVALTRSALSDTGQARAIATPCKWCRARQKLCRDISRAHHVEIRKYGARGGSSRCVMAGLIGGASPLGSRMSMCRTLNHRASPLRHVQSTTTSYNEREVLVKYDRSVSTICASTH